MTKPALYQVGDCPYHYTVIEVVTERPASYRVRCKCGAEKVIPQFRLQRNKSCRSCHMKRLHEENLVTCNRKDNWHACDQYLRPIWNAIKQRIYNTNCDVFSDYGGRGLTMSDEWANSYYHFRDWIIENLGERPPEKSLDRVNNDYGYHPYSQTGEVQLRWATSKEQKLNQRKRKSHSRKYGMCEIGGIKGSVSYVLNQLGIASARWKQKMEPKIHKKSMSLREAIEWCLNKTYTNPPKISYIEKSDLRLNL